MKNEKQKHTPGPWRYVGGKMRVSEDRVILDTENAPVALAVDNGEFYDSQTDANARLIAASPDLLAACKLIAKGSTEGRFEHPTFEDMKILRAAIAKAEGKQ